MTDPPFVPEGFEAPRGLETPAFRLEPLGPQHNDSDHAAWSSSIAHIRATPGFEGHGWPPLEGMSLEENRSDLQGHADDFAARTGFTYTVLAPDGDEVIGCVYLYPARDGEHDARARSWVRADVRELDAELYRVVSQWLAEAWPFERVVYAPR
jgi:hypothetical protein